MLYQSAHEHSRVSQNVNPFKMHQAGTSHFYPVLLFSVPASAELIPDVTRHNHITETTCISAGKRCIWQLKLALQLFTDE
jgi:hypothetical protein